MPNLQTTNIDNSSIQLGDNRYDDNVLGFPAPIVLLAGTILARKESDGKLLPFVKGGDITIDGTPNCILHYEVEAAAVGDKIHRPLISGCVNINKLVIHADGDSSNIDKSVQDGLRKFGIIALSVENLSKQDNQ